MNRDVILVDIMQQVVAAMVPLKDDGTPTGISSINFQPGRSIQILKSLSDLDNSITLKGEKYPLVAMILPVQERRGISVIYYAKVIIPRIVFAQIVSWDGTESILDRYAPTGVLKTILYPCYYEFLKRVAWHPNIIGSDPYMFEHTKIDNPGTQPVGEGTNDYIDSIEILNLELTLSQFKTC